jgi:hypothetical protein
MSVRLKIELSNKFLLGADTRSQTDEKLDGQICPTLSVL